MPKEILSSKLSYSWTGFTSFAKKHLLQILNCSSVSIVQVYRISCTFSFFYCDITKSFRNPPLEIIFKINKILSRLKLMCLRGNTWKEYPVRNIQHITQILFLLIIKINFLFCLTHLSEII